MTVIRTSERRYVRSPLVLWRMTHDRVVLLVPGEEDLFELEGTGPLLWEHLSEPHTASELAARLARMFEAPEMTVRADIAPVLDALVRKSLVEVR